MIPGFLITWATFPGVIVHELAHALFCRLFNVEIYEVKYFIFHATFGAPAGYVLHEPAEETWKNLFIGLGPFFLNTILGAVVAAPAILPIIQFDSVDPLDLFLGWLGVSIAMHAFPSTGDAAAMWQSLKKEGTPISTKLWGYPLMALIGLGALGSIFWLDLLYGIAVTCLVPKFLVQLLA